MKLKPCPFCGRSPKKSDRPANSNAVHNFVAFRSCMGGGFTAHAQVYGIGSTKKEASNNADSKWNERHEIS